MLIASAGSLPPHRLSAAHVADIDETLYRSAFSFTTKALRACALRRILRWLWEYHGAPKLDAEVRLYHGIRPRSVTVEREEVDALLAAAPPHMRLWILLCSDLAIRSGTAARLGASDYMPAERLLRFPTKRGSHLTLPVTAEIEALLSQCDMHSPVSFVRQLWRLHFSGHGHPPDLNLRTACRLRQVFRDLCLQVGITRRIVPHDLRRTTAVSLYTHTTDVRDVQALLGHRSLQSTIWYLDHDLRPVKRSDLEIIKRPAWRKEGTA